MKLIGQSKKRQNKNKKSGIVNNKRTHGEKTYKIKQEMIKLEPKTMKLSPMLLARYIQSSGSLLLIL